MLEGKSILIVDDNIDNLSLIAAYLRPLNVLLETAQSGIEAIHLVDKTDFDILILDLHMPGIDGWETAYRLRNKGFAGKIIAFSALGDVSKNFEERHSDFNGFVPKPCYKSDFIAYLKLKVV